MAEKFVRFVTHDLDKVTGERIGFFKAAYALRRSGSLTEDSHDRLSKLLDWFDGALEAPERFHRSSNPHAHGKGLSWFKPAAHEHIRKAREVLDILNRRGVQSEMLTTMRPGYILYEDDIQVCAVPFKDGA